MATGADAWTDPVERHAARPDGAQPASLLLDLERLPDRLRLPLTFDPQALAQDLARLADQAWTRHFVADHFDGDWSVLPLRAPAGAAHPILRIVSHPGITAWEDTEFLVVCPYFESVLGALACRIDAVRLMRLTQGSLIREHCDPHLGAQAGMVRLHIPVSTNPRVDFRLNGVRVDMAPGECWYLRLSDRHSVRNDGDEDRIHLVIDTAVNEWLTDVLRAAASSASAR